MRVAFLTNILTPYRIRFYDGLQMVLKQRKDCLKVFVMTDSLPMRPWSYKELRREYTQLLKGIKVFIKGNDYLFNPKVIKEISKYNPDILIIAGSWTYPTFLETIFSRKLKNACIRLLWTESHNRTGINNKSKTNRIVRALKKEIFAQFDGFCIPGQYALETLSEMIELKEKKIVYLPNLVDSEFYDKANELRNNREELREKRGIPIDCFVFFIPASLYELKGHIPFFENVGDAIKGREVLFVLAGEGPYKSKITETAQANEINILMCGYQTQEEIREWLALSDAFLLPSLSDANPLSNIEAAWAGLPLCVSCYVGNAPELVEDRLNGVIFDTLNKTSVCEKIEFILSQEKQWLLNACDLSHRKAESSFSIDRETLKFIDALDDLRLNR